MITDIITAAEALEAALSEYSKSNFSGLAYSLVTVRRAELRAAIRAYEERPKTFKVPAR